MPLEAAEFAVGSEEVSETKQGDCCVNLSRGSKCWLAAEWSESQKTPSSFENTKVHSVSKTQQYFFSSFNVLMNVMRIWQALVCRMKIKLGLWIEADKRFTSREAWYNFFLILLGQRRTIYVPVCHKRQLRLCGEASSQKSQTCSYALDHKKMLQHHSDFCVFCVS